ncbi:Hypothetical_protein [Hexamita inflata]|uniref:Hypothetical_protein n=1 Tax=Hexamita inflata TaxID=28002 RepID=A0AA86R0U5_9EUKA|nr:Hypothetical protein HINF_LOCUS52451 [Hexamita inflata]
MNFQCMIMYQQDKDEVTAQECIFIFFYFRKLIIVYCTQLKQFVSILQAGVKGVHVTNNIYFIDSSSSRYGSQNSKMQFTFKIVVNPSSPESLLLFKYVEYLFTKKSNCENQQFQQFGNRIRGRCLNCQLQIEIHKAIQFHCIRSSAQTVQL